MIQAKLYMVSARAHKQVALINFNLNISLVHVRVGIPLITITTHHHRTNKSLNCFAWFSQSQMMNYRKITVDLHIRASVKASCVSLRGHSVMAPATYKAPHFSPRISRYLSYSGHLNVAKWCGVRQMQTAHWQTADYNG